MPLLKLDRIALHYGTRELLKNVDFTLYKGNKIGLLGRNGEGKTTFLNVVANLTRADSGERWVRPGIKIASLDQTLPEASATTVYDVVADGLKDVGALLKAFHHAIHDGDMAALSRAQDALEAKDGWMLQQKVDTIISQLALPADALMKNLSGGWRKRVALAQALVIDPDILLLDEPTNHLDIPAIEWLEKQLRDYRGALFLVTHDRAFLQNVVNQIVELDRGSLYAWEGDYQSFLTYRAQQLASEERSNALFDKKLAQEEVWIRQGIKARRTRNEGRVRALESLRAEHAERVNRQGKANFNVENADRSGKIVAQVDDVSHGFGGNAVISGFSTVIMRGDRIGLVGANGAGKSTLLKILLGELQPEQGTVKIGTKLEIAYFDQMRNQLDMDKTLIDNICGGRDFIEINGRNRHAISYLGDFLFTPQQSRTVVSALSGGEQNRAILAKLFSKPANVLVLDEPTNDLDIETLELLEEILVEFKGTLLLVSHDRAFMDNVVTGIMVFTGGGQVREYVGGYSDWVAHGGSLPAATDKPVAVTSSAEDVAAVKPGPAPSPPNKKRSYQIQRELDNQPALVEKLENRKTTIEQTLSAPDFYNNDPAAVAAELGKLAAVEQELSAAYRRWQILEES